jgi:hypothetical protein
VAYIASHEEHHRSKIFQEEYRDFINRYGSRWGLPRILFCFCSDRCCCRSIIFSRNVSKLIWNTPGSPASSDSLPTRNPGTLVKSAQFAESTGFVVVKKRCTRGKADRVGLEFFHICRQ